MATNLGTLTLNLLANTGSYTQGLQRAERQTQESTENMAEGYDLVGKSIAALSGVVAGISVGSVAALALEAINAGNEVKKLADLSNADTQQFQYYAVGAKTARIEVEQFADQMKDMQDRIGEFQQTGGGPLADFFKNIAPLVGVTIDQFQKLSGPDAIQLFYSSLQKVFATENDIKFYMEAIVSDSSKLIPLLRDGGKGFKEWGDKAKEAGAIMSDSMIQQMDEAKKNLQVFDLQWQGLKTTLINDAMPAISSVIRNIDIATNVLTIGGAFLVGTYIPTIYGAVAALVEKANAQLADFRATQIANEIAAQRSARILQLTEIELNNARVQAARMTGMARLAFIERTIIPLEQQHTAAVAANTVAQNANNASKSIAATVGRGLIGVLGGPVGLGMLVAGAAASYLLLRDNTDKATKSLNENGIAVTDVVIKYQQLTEAQQRTQLRAETKTLVDLTDGYKDASNKLLSYVVNIEKYGYVSAGAAEKVGELILLYQKGQLSSGDLATAVSKLTGVSDQAKSKIDEQAGAVDRARKEMLQQKTVTEAMIQENLKLADSHGKVADGVSKQALELYKLTSEQRSYVTQVQSDVLRDKFIQNQIKQGVSPDRAKFQADAYSGAKVDLAKPNEIPKLVKDAEMEAWALNQREKAREEAEKKADEAAKKRQAAREKARNDAEKLREDQSKSRDNLSTDYADEFKKLNIGYQKSVQEINKANFGAEKSKYLDLAKARYDFNTEIYLRQLTEENDSFRWSEEYKLQYYYDTQREIVKNSGRYNDELRDVRLNSLRDQEVYELAQIRLVQDKRISDAGEMLRTDLQNIEIKYAFERKQIEENIQLSKDERQKRVALSFAAEEHQKRQNLNSATAAWGGTYADLTGTGPQYQMERDKFSKYDESQALFDAQMALADSAAEREAIWQAHTERMAMIDQDYWVNSTKLNLSYGEQISGSFVDMAKSIYGEQSSTYRAMFAVQKAFSIASSIVAITNGIALAAANPFPYNLAAMATVAASTATLVSDISSVAGFATGGHITGQGTGTSDDIPIWASNGEFMIRAAAVEKLGLANLDYINRTGMLPPRFATGGLINSDIMKTKTIGNTPSKGVDYNAMQSQQGQQSQQNDVNLRVINSFDDSTIHDAMATPEGEKVVLNIIKRNKTNLGLR